MKYNFDRIKLSIAQMTDGTHDVALWLGNGAVAIMPPEVAKAVAGKLLEIAEVARVLNVGTDREECDVAIVPASCGGNMQN